MKKLHWILAWIACATALGAAEDGSQVVVIYNSAMPASRQVAEYYAQRRGVPASQLIALKTPETEAVSRKEFRELIQTPLLQTLEERGIWTYRSEMLPATNGPARQIHRLINSKIRYAVLCYGMPTKILNDTNLVETGSDKVRPELRGNNAAVDSELTMLPWSKTGYYLFSFIPNPFHGATNSALFHPTNNILMVSRLDGPSPQIAKRLVDLALQADRDGLWGRAYFDARGTTDASLQTGEEFMRNGATVTTRLGFETILDTQPGTFGTGFTMSQIAFYAGWYTNVVSGPFTLPNVELMPGAFAYHLFSFNAANIRTANSGAWTAGLLEKGATATFGFVDEPYLQMTPDVGIFCHRFLMGFSYGEAVCAAQRTFSWQTMVIGDPLYRPYGLPPQERHAALAQAKSTNLVWACLRVVNLNAATGAKLPEMIDYLEKLPETRKSAVLLEKLAELYHQQKDSAKAENYMKQALKADPSPQQKIRLSLTLVRWMEEEKNTAAAFACLQQFPKDFPKYPDLAKIYYMLSNMAERLGKTAQAAKYQGEFKRLSGPGS